MKYGKVDNAIADKIRGTVIGFLESAAWRELRRKAVKQYGRRCMKCGTTPRNPTLTHVDHIKPRKLFPELALVFDNLQILCARCNKAKANKHCTDYRPTLARPMEK